MVTSITAISKLNQYLIAFLVGIALAIPWLGVNGVTLFGAFIPMLYLLNYTPQNQTNKNLLKTFIALVTFNALTSWWIMHATKFGAVAVILLNTSLMWLVWRAAYTVKKKYNKTITYLFLTALWITLEYTQLRWEIAWPWLNLGNGFAYSTKWIQWYEYTGTLGGTLWVWLTNIAILEMLVAFSQKKTKTRIIKICIAITIVAAPIAISNNIYKKTKQLKNKQNCLVVILQPNINPYTEKFNTTTSFKQQLQKTINLLPNNSSKQTAFIVAPETTLQEICENTTYVNQNLLIQQCQNWLKPLTNTQLIIGASSYQVNQNQQIKLFNSALAITHNTPIQIRHKSILVSGVEKMPFVTYLPFLENYIIKLGGAFGTLGTDKTPKLFYNNAHNIAAGTVICYESVFGHYVSRFVRKGAQLLMIITNDGWWKNTPGYKQHLAFAKLRAIENRRSIARSANTGISAFINKLGQLQQQIPWQQETAIQQTVELNNTITIYTKFGDWIAWPFLIIAPLLFVTAICKKKNAKPKHKY